MIGAWDWGSFAAGVLGAFCIMAVIAGIFMGKDRADQERRKGICRSCGGTKRSPLRGCIALYHTEAS